MSVDDAAQVGTSAVNLLMERELGGRSVRAIDRAIGVHADDILTAKRTFIDPGGRDPQIPVVFADREVAARRRRHAVSVDALDSGENLVAGVLVRGEREHLLLLSQVTESLHGHQGSASSKTPLPSVNT